MDDRYQKIRGNLVDALDDTMEELTARGRTEMEKGRISSSDFADLEKLISQFLEHKTPEMKANVHDMLKYTVGTRVTYDEQRFEQLLYRIYNLGIPSMWGPVFE